MEMLRESQACAVAVSYLAGELARLKAVRGM